VDSLKIVRYFESCVKPLDEHLLRISQRFLIEPSAQILRDFTTGVFILLTTKKGKQIVSAEST
jgi:hypothetical protein